MAHASPLLLQHNHVLGALCALGATMCFSSVEMGVKLLSDGYALHQLVFIRSIIGMIALLAVVMPLNGGLRMIRTRRPGAHLLRSALVIVANTCLFLGLAALPIAEATAIFFVSPLIICVMSVVFLGETVGPRRWFAIVLGLVGVLVILRPGSDAFRFAALFPVAAATLYAAMNMITRRIGATEGAWTMTFFTQSFFILAAATIGLCIGDGRFADAAPPALEFLLRAWQPLAARDLPILMMIGLVGMLGGYLLSQAYRMSEAAFAAAFEYVAMPMAIVWGITIFGTWPDRWTWIGIALILGSGVFLVLREAAAEGRTRAIRPPRR